MRHLVLAFALLILSGCGGGGASDSGTPANPTAEPTLALAPAAPPLFYVGPVNVHFVSYTTLPVRAVRVSTLALDGGLPTLADPQALAVGTLDQTGMYTVVVEFEGAQAPVSATLYFGWPNVTVYLFPG